LLECQGKVKAPLAEHGLSCLITGTEQVHAVLGGFTLWIKQKLTAGCCVRNSGRKMGPGAGKDVGVETVPGGLIMPKGRKIEEIWIDLSK
jgi:hypothetical protein